MRLTKWLRMKFR